MMRNNSYAAHIQRHQRFVGANHGVARNDGPFQQPARPLQQRGNRYKALQPKPWSPYLASDKGKVADWSWPWVCGGCTEPRFAAY